VGLLNQKQYAPIIWLRITKFLPVKVVIFLHSHRQHKGVPHVFTILPTEYVVKLLGFASFVDETWYFRSFDVCFTYYKLCYHFIGQRDICNFFSINYLFITLVQ
jgi:hypothetical protein